MEERVEGNGPKVPSLDPEAEFQKFLLRKPVLSQNSAPLVKRLASRGSVGTVQERQQVLTLAYTC